MNNIINFKPKTTPLDKEKIIAKVKDWTALTGKKFTWDEVRYLIASEEDIILNNSLRELIFEDKITVIYDEQKKDFRFLDKSKEE